MLKERIRNENIMEENHWPIKIILNEIEDAAFLKTVKLVSESEGFGVESGTCLFPNDLDEYDIAQGNGFTGVEFGLYSGEEIIVDYDVFYHYLVIMCEAYLTDFPSAKEAIKSALEKYRATYDIRI